MTESPQKLSIRQKLKAIWQQCQAMVLAGSIVGVLGSVVFLIIGFNQPAPITSPPSPDLRPLERQLQQLTQDVQLLQQQPLSPPTDERSRVAMLEARLATQASTLASLQRQQQWLLLETLWQRASAGHRFADILPMAHGVFNEETLALLTPYADVGFITPLDMLHDNLATGQSSPSTNTPLDAKGFFSSLVTVRRHDTTSPNQPPSANPLYAALISRDDSRITQALQAHGTPAQRDRWQARLAALDAIRLAQAMLPHD
jgi:hypothetical protein